MYNTLLDAIHTHAASVLRAGALRPDHPLWAAMAATLVALRAKLPAMESDRRAVVTDIVAQLRPGPTGDGPPPMPAPMQLAWSLICLMLACDRAPSRLTITAALHIAVACRDVTSVAQLLRLAQQFDIPPSGKWRLALQAARLLPTPDDGSLPLWPQLASFDRDLMLALNGTNGRGATTAAVELAAPSAQVPGEAAAEPKRAALAVVAAAVHEATSWRDRLAQWWQTTDFGSVFHLDLV